MTRSKSALAIIFIVLLLIFLTPYAAAQSSVYRVFVDEWYGFKRAIEANYTPFKYENQTLNLNVGDTVIWVNDADNESITIVSKEGLWADAYLKYIRSSFKYIFNKSGTYEVYMKEFPRRPHQTIIVAPVETPIVTTPPPTPTATETAAPTATAPTATITQTPQATSPGINLWYILLAFIVVAGIVVFALLKKK